MTEIAPNPNAIKAGDNEPITVTLSDLNGPVNLVGVISVTMRMKSKVPGSGHAPISAPCDVLQTVDGNGRIKDRGKVQYVWGAHETDTPGVYGLEWVVVFADSKRKTFPNDRTVTFEIEPAAV